MSLTAAGLPGTFTRVPFLSPRGEPIAQLVFAKLIIIFEVLSIISTKSDGLPNENRADLWLLSKDGADDMLYRGNHYLMSFQRGGST